MSEISDRIVQRAGELELNQSQLAKKLGLSRAAVGLWFNGRSPSADKIIPIAQALGVSADWLLAGVNKFGCSCSPVQSVSPDNSCLEQ